jgi:6,7-dimethyl-8-ribityllumazine synthase
MSQNKPSVLNISGSSFSMGIVAARYNQQWVDMLLKRVQQVWIESGVDPDQITIERVPGSLEIPYAVDAMLRRKTPDCVVALGLVFTGATQHHELVLRESARSLMDLSLKYSTPIIQGILGVSSEQEADERCGVSYDRGGEFANAGLEMAQLKQKWFL